MWMIFFSFPHVPRELYRERISFRDYVIFDEKYPWQDVLKKIKEPIYVVEPGSMRGEWKVTCVRDNPRDFTNRKDLPKEWAGKRDTELVQITGVKDAVFCHNKLFTAYAKSKEGAIKLAELAFK